MFIISDTAHLLLLKLFSEMAHMIHDDHNNQYVFSSQTDLVHCPEDRCRYIVAMLRDIDREFNT